MSNVLKALARGGAVGDYEISRSLRFNSADSAYLARTPASAGNRKTWTWSGWVKSSNDSGTQTLFAAGVSGAGPIYFFFNSGALRLRDFSTGSGVNIFITNAVYRDPSAWYHIVLAIDTTDGTPANRQKLYVNGTQVTSFSSETNFPLDQLTAINNNVSHLIGSWIDPLNPFLLNGYMADINFVDGAALTPSSFGEVNEITGVWTPIRFAGPWNVDTGVNGFHLEFADNSDVTATTLGKDTSGNGNNWTPSGSPGFSVTAGAGNDSLVDSPTRYGTDTGAGGEVRGNYCTLNPLSSRTGAGTVLSNGNLSQNGSSDKIFTGTIASKGGKFYYEYVVEGTSGYPTIGLANTDTYDMATGPGETSDSWAIWLQTGDVRNNASTAYSLGGFSTTNILQVAWDVDAGKVWFGKNNTWGNSGNPATGTNPAFTNLSAKNIAPVIKQYAAGSFNFGQRPFAYTAPSGFKALVTTNLPEPTVVQGEGALSEIE